MTTLYQLANQYLAAQDMANHRLENEEDIEEDTIAMLIDTIDSIDDSMENKVENIIKYILNLQADFAAYKAEEERFAKRKKTTENTIKGLKEYTMGMMTLVGKDKIRAGLFNARLQKNNPSVLIVDEKKIPEKYREAQPDKILGKEILADLKLKKEIDGAVLAPEKKHFRFN
ncbi:hypothetical protein BSK59_13495 [Paenibacillus odorifer]|uniref:siphovirus Gp157 family protein n=1 Tax=Paenibacillus odorifer TaxID=189426 RepID=UPI00096DA66B|nr:siphovirus Gp157 family protein [Paenibacillus odorifer]OME55485.1 hypothetical protein BSK59_13495 [Paenibacillus odorifer]